MLFAFGGNAVDMDVEKTRAMYAKLPYVWQQRGCPVCRNFAERLCAMREAEMRLLPGMGVCLAKCRALRAYVPGTGPAAQKYRLSYSLSGAAPCPVKPGGWEGVKSGLFACFAQDGEELGFLPDRELKCGHM